MAKYPAPRRSTLNKYQSLISEYIKRRKKVRKKYLARGINWQRSSDYAAEVSRINQSIRKWRKALKRAQERHEKMRHIDRVVCEFMGIPQQLKSPPLRHSVKLTRGVNAAKWQMAHHLFYRWGLENGFFGSYLSEYIGCKDLATAGRNRLNFIRLMNSKHPEWKTVWKTFQEHASEYDQKLITHVNEKK